ncbi:MAG: enoyl-CoA hydratase/isomerase family protein [Alphaproteobacteria bacterium]|nr:enoyl-CoA hydratase/isomerase family protein [Alphaproteobacteria bacterium]
MAFETFRFDVDADGIAVAVFDVPGRSMNTLTAEALRDIAAIAARIRTDNAIRGAILTSGKPSGFCAGADLGEMGDSAGGDASLSEEERLRRAFENGYGFNRVLRELETCGKPVVAAINGLALGGGLEVCLATHYRIVTDNPRIQLGLPESKIGLLPGGGGTQRLPRLIGAQKALELIQTGNPVSPQEALKLGIVNAIAAPGTELLKAKDWIRTKGDPVQPWDKRDYKVPGGAPQSPGGSGVFTMGNALLRKTTYNNFPAQKFIMSCVYEGLQVPIDAGLRIESRYFARLLMHPVAKNMIRSMFLSMQELGKGARRPRGEPPTDVKKVAVIGAGMMGAGIAYVQALAGIETILLDTTIEAAQKGKVYTQGLLGQQVERGRLAQDKADATLALIKPTTDYADVKGADLVVEAVYENREIKASVTKLAEAQLGPRAVFGSNTSTLPITGLAEASVRPENFIGIHFFSPVDRMGLVELILGKATGDHALAVAIDYVKKIRKTPIVVNDARGFYTSRCFGTYLAEGQEMLAEGIAPAIIDNVGRMTGMPRGPLELADDVALDLAYKVREQTRKDMGDRYEAGPSDALIEAMVVKYGRFGRKNGKGFYDYPADGKKRLWPGLTDLVAVRTREADPAAVEVLKKRFLYRQAVEAARCFGEGVITDPRDGDVGAILGWGFAPWTGGPISLIDTAGLATFVTECDRMAQAYGPRFAPPQILRDMAAKGETFYGNAARKAA